MNTEFMLLAIYNKPRLTFEETCKAIGIAVNTGYNQRQKEVFPVKMSGHPLMADIRDVAEYLDTQREKAT